MKFERRWYMIGTVCTALVPILLAIIAVLLFRSCYYN